MILVYNIFSVALLGAKLASLKWPEPLEMPTRPLEELQKKYCILKSMRMRRAGALAVLVHAPCWCTRRAGVRAVLMRSLC